MATKQKLEEVKDISQEFEKTSPQAKEQPVGSFTKDSEMITIPFYQLKPLFSAIKVFELAVASMHNIENTMLSEKKSHPVFIKDIDSQTGELSKEFLALHGIVSK